MGLPPPYWLLRRVHPDVLVIVLGPVLLAMWILNRGMIQFAGYEQSINANVSWLMHLGRRPCIDFPCALPPNYFLGLKYAVAGFGVTWRANVIVAALYASIAWCWCYGLLRALGMSWRESLFLAVLLESVTLLLTSYWWYNHVACINLTLLFLSALAWVHHPRSAAITLSMLAALLLSLMDKPNGWPLLMGLSLFFLLSGTHRRRMLLIFVVCVLLLALIGWENDVDLALLLRSYLHAGKYRSFSWEALTHGHQLPRWHAAVDYYRCMILGVVFVLIAILSLFAFRSKVIQLLGNAEARTVVAVYLSALVVGVIYLFTNFELKITDATLPMIAAGVWAFTYGKRFPVFGSLITAVLLLSIVEGMYIGWTRYRVWWGGDDWFYEERLSHHSPVVPYFTGLRCGERLLGVTHNIKRLVEKNPRATYMFGPWLQWAYPAFQVEPPMHLPPWWHAGTSYTDRDMAAIRRAFIQKKFDFLVFVRLPDGTPSAYGMPNHWLTPDLQEHGHRIYNDLAPYYDYDRKLPDLYICTPRRGP